MSTGEAAGGPLTQKTTYSETKRIPGDGGAHVAGELLVLAMMNVGRKRRERRRSGAS